MLSVRPAGDHLYGKLLFTCLSLVMSMMVSFCAVLFPHVSWMRSGTQLSQSLRVFLPTLRCGARLFIVLVRYRHRK